MPRLPSRSMTKKRPWMVVPSKHLPLLPPFVFLFLLLSLLVRQLLSNRYVASPHPLSPSHPQLSLDITHTPIHRTFSSLRDRELLHPDAFIAPLRSMFSSTYPLGIDRVLLHIGRPVTFSPSFSPPLSLPLTFPLDSSTPRP